MTTSSLTIVTGAVPSLRGRQAIGRALAVIAVLIMAATLAISRAGVTGHLGPADLLALRFGVGGLVMLPVLIAGRTRLSRSLAVAAVPLSFAHGWGMAGLSLIGLQFAPASHGGALGPGCIPLWVALLGYALYRHRTSTKQGLGITSISMGVVALLAASYRGLSTAHAVQGDLFFVASSVLAAGYFVYVERHGVPAKLGAALVMVLSGLVVVPAYLVFMPSRIPSAPWREVALQVVVQGPLMSFAYLALHQAVLFIGSKPVSMLLALIPVTTIATGAFIAGDPVSWIEALAVIAVSVGVAIGAAFRARE
ncbi:MAG TPA: DMT family transporter [Kofleriaceae bacterium]